MIIKVEHSDKELIKVDNIYLTTLKPLINNTDSEDIINAIEESIPSPTKLDTIRKELSNGFTYEVNFDENTETWTLNFKENGEINLTSSSNTQAINFQLNEVATTLPVEVNAGDNMDIFITKTNPSQSAQVILKAKEFNIINNQIQAGLSPDLIEGLTCWIDYDTNVTLNYVAETGDLQTTSGSNIIQAAPGGTSPGFTDEFIDRKIKIKLAAGDAYRTITAVNSSTEIVVDQTINITESMIQFECARVAQVDNQASYGGNFAQTDEVKQPYYLENHQNGHSAIQLLNAHWLTADRFWGYDCTIFIVGQSTDTRTTQMNSMFCGDYDGYGGFWMTEWANPSPIHTYIGFLGTTGSTSVQVGDLRNKFHLLMGQLEYGNFRARKNGINMIPTPNNPKAFRGTTKLMQIGSRGDSQIPGKNNQLEFIYFNRFLNSEEVKAVENYLIAKYNLF